MDRAAYDLHYELERSHFWRVGKRKLVLSWLRPYMDARGTSRILDIGSAESRLPASLKRWGSVTLLEPDAETVRKLQVSGEFEVHLGALPDSVPLCGGYDLVTLLDVLEHISDDAAALRRIFALVEPGGLFLLTVPAYQWLWSNHDVALHHKRRYSVSQLRALLGPIGFSVLRVSYYTSLLFPVIMIERLLRKLTETPSAARYDVRPPGGLTGWICGGAMTLERRILRRAHLPFGSAIIALCQRPTAESRIVL